MSDAPRPTDRLRALATPANAVALLLIALSVGAFLWFRSHPDQNVFGADGFRAYVDGLGWRGPLLYMAVIAIAVVVSQIPGVPLAIAAGAMWGPLTAGLYSVIGGFVGGMIAYYLGRSLGRSVMAALTGRVLILRDARGEAFLGWVILVTRALPVLSFDVISYAAGVSGVSARIYAAATLIGMIPSTLLLTSLGSTFRPTVGWGLAVSAAAGLLLVGLPWLLQRWDVLHLRDTFRFETIGGPDGEGGS